MPEVIIDSVITSDSTPGDPPYKISGNLGFDTAEVTLRVTTVDGSKIRALRFLSESAGRQDGHKVINRGQVAGTYNKCGEGTSCLALDQDTEMTQDTSYNEVIPHFDGDIQITVYAVSESEGWTI